MDTLRAFFVQNQGNFFDFQQRAGEASPLPPSCAPGTNNEIIGLYERTHHTVNDDYISTFDQLLDTHKFYCIHH